MESELNGAMGAESVVAEIRPSARLAAKIVSAMGEVGSVAKAGTNRDQGYKYQKAADIFAAAQQAFVKYGVCLTADEFLLEWPESLTTKNGATMFISRATMAYTLRDTESDETITVKHTGVGYDTSDKALNKAKTAAQKYFLKQTLLIGEEEDDADAEHVEPRGAAACPSCGVVGAIIKGKEEYGGGWLCFGKKGGCGAKFTTDPAELPGAGKKETVDTSTSQAVHGAASSQASAQAQKRPETGRAKKTAPSTAETTATLLAGDSVPAAAIAEGAGADPLAGAADTSDRISAEDLAWLEGELKRQGVNAEDMLRFYKITELKDFKAKQMPELKQKLARRAQKTAEGKSA